VDTQDEGLALEMGVQVPRPRRFFPPEYKAEVVELIRSTGKTVGQVARELDLTETAVRHWGRRGDLDASRRTDGLPTAEREELRRLRRENRELHEERGCPARRWISLGPPRRILSSGTTTAGRSSSPGCSAVPRSSARASWDSSW
jgi:transposase